MAYEPNPSAYLAAFHCAQDDLTEVDREYKELCQRKGQVEELVHELELLLGDAGPGYGRMDSRPRPVEVPKERLAAQEVVQPATEAAKPSGGPTPLGPLSVVDVVDSVPSNVKSAASAWPRAFYRRQAKG